jgi:hypothetical protein
MVRFMFNLVSRRSLMPKKAKRAAKPAPAAAKSTLNAKKGKRYAPKEKEGLLTKWAELRKGGASAVVAAKQLGVPYITLNAWAKKAGLKLPKKSKGGRKPGRKPGKAAAVRTLRKAVRLPRGPRPKAAPLAGGLTLVTPAGYRIEGIETADLIRVLQALR